MAAHCGRAESGSKFRDHDPVYWAVNGLPGSINGNTVSAQVPADSTTYYSYSAPTATAIGAGYVNGTPAADGSTQFPATQSLNRSSSWTENEILGLGGLGYAVASAGTGLSQIQSVPSGSSAQDSTGINAAVDVSEPVNGVAPATDVPESETVSFSAFPKGYEGGPGAQWVGENLTLDPYPGGQSQQLEFDFGDGTNDSGVTLVNGRIPINSQYAGGVYPVENLPTDLQARYPNSVSFTPQGFPDFSPYSVAEVKVPNLTGNYPTDSALANEAAGLSETPQGFVWHHVEDGETLQLIPEDIHDAVRHTGGSAIIKGGN